jgi:hypothetical protein
VDGTAVVVYECMALAWLLYLCLPAPSTTTLQQALAPLQRGLAMLTLPVGDEWGPMAVGQERIYRVKTHAQTQRAFF